jgi:hypothetical protein
MAESGYDIGAKPHPSPAPDDPANICRQTFLSVLADAVNPDPRRMASQLMGKFGATRDSGNLYRQDECAAGTPRRTYKLPMFEVYSADYKAWSEASASTGTPCRTDSRPRIDVDSEEFKAWFERSVLAGPDGRPNTFWHGTFQDFNSFERGHQSSPRHGGAGLYFSSARSYARVYGYNLFEVCLKVKRPIVTGCYSDLYSITRQQADELQRAGYDALTFSPSDNPDAFNEIAVFQPEQIRIIRKEHVGA